MLHPFLDFEKHSTKFICESGKASFPEKIHLVTFVKCHRCKLLRKRTFLLFIYLCIYLFIFSLAKLRKLKLTFI